MDYNPPGSSVRGIFQARILEWVTIPFSRKSSQPRAPALAGRLFTNESPGKPLILPFVVEWLSHVQLFATPWIEASANKGWSYETFRNLEYLICTISINSHSSFTLKYLTFLHVIFPVVFCLCSFFHQ